MARLVTGQGPAENNVAAAMRVSSSASRVRHRRQLGQALIRPDARVRLDRVGRPLGFYVAAGHAGRWKQQPDHVRSVEEIVALLG
jgi:hypothetical protein